MHARPDGTYRLEDYAPSPYLIPDIRLCLALDDKETRIVAEMTVVRREGVREEIPLELNGEELRLLGLSIDGQPVADDAYEVSDDGLRLTGLNGAGRFTLRIETTVDPSANRQLMGLYLSNGLFCTQCEAEGFRRITYFLDRPDILSIYTVRIEADEKRAPLLLSNGNPVESGALPGGRHFAVWHDPFPKPCYLFALVAGELGLVSDEFTTAGGRQVRLGIHVEPGKETHAAYAMGALKRCMRWDEEVFGREYDLDVFNIVTVSDFNMGAMENKGLNIFNDKFVLADMDTATDADFASVETLVAHEYFHNWTGNRITCRDWFQLCLKEGLTVYRDHEFSADQRSRTVRRVQEVRLLKAQQFPEDQGPLAHPVRPVRYKEINNFYTATVYEKGAEVVRMLRILLGPEKFRAGMHLYFERHDGQAVTIEDFLRVFADASGQDLDQFALWYHQAGTPHLAVSAHYDEASSCLLVDIEQSLPSTPDGGRKRLMHIPLTFGLVAADGTEMPFSATEAGEIEGNVIHVRKRRHRVRLSGITQRPVLSVNRGFSAPVTIALEVSHEDQMFLAGHDPDLFGRWQSLTTVLTEILVGATRSLRWGAVAPQLDAVSGLIGRTARDERLEPAFRALLLALPSETDIAREIGSNLDPDAIHSARSQVQAAIATANRTGFADLYKALRDTGAYSPDGDSAGRRALRNALLEFLCDGRSEDLALQHFRQAGNMTDRLAALQLLVHRYPGHPATPDALAWFGSRYADNPLVMDKWFSVQATAPGPATVDAVARLKRHPHFSISNPNRVRSLVMSFAGANQTGFHRPDGAGYELLADTILEADKGNPHLSARLATAFRSWRALEPERQKCARRTLVRLAGAGGRSRDLADIIERTLA